FHLTGSARDWSAAERLGLIGVPTLILSGRHDEATPAVQDTLVRGIMDTEQVIFEDSSHTPFLEERGRYIAVLAEWLARHDPPSVTLAVGPGGVRSAGDSTWSRM